MVGPSSAMRRYVRVTATRMGLVPELERAGRFVHGARAGSSWRRNNLDNQRVKLLAAGILRESSNCIDVGANDGTLLELFVALAPRGRHIAYEPIPALADDLAERFPAVDVRRSALSNEIGETTFVVNKRLPSRSGMRDVGYKPEETETLQVPVTALDSDLAPDYKPHLIKIDVEGAEGQVFEGARETLRAHAPLVLFEHQSSTAMHYAIGPDEIFDFLVDDLKFRIFDMDANGPYSRARLWEAYKAGRHFNFLAAPSR